VILARELAAEGRFRATENPGGAGRLSLAERRSWRRKCLVRDNFVGFDMSYASRLFAPFQRLHPPGSATDLGSDSRTVQRIVHRHGGRIRAAASPGEVATSFFTRTVGKV
jgi:light-regulated signal transduction histidine kinase (bacteriophytochrome)